MPAILSIHCAGHRVAGPVTLRMALPVKETGQLIAFDVGNTAVKCAVSTGDVWDIIFRIPTRPIPTLPDRLAESLTAAGESTPTGPRRWVASSVCPEADEALAQNCRRRDVPGPEIFGQHVPIPIPTLVRSPAQTGADRLLCALGARKIVGAPCIVIGAGTAITVDLVDTRGRFAGGAIAPGFGLAARALHEGAARLPLVESAAPARAVGRDTREAIQSGVDAFCRGGVAALVSAMSRELAPPHDKVAPVVVTGGASERLVTLDGPGEGAWGRLARRVPELIFVGMAAALRIGPA